MSSCPVMGHTSAGAGPVLQLRGCSDDVALHQVSPAPYPQQQLHMDTQGKAKPGQDFPLTLSNHFQLRGFPEGQISTETLGQSKGLVDVPLMAGAAAFPSSPSPLTQRTGVSFAGSRPPGRLRALHVLSPSPLRGVAPFSMG